MNKATQELIAAPSTMAQSEGEEAPSAVPSTMAQCVMTVFDRKYTLRILKLIHYAIIVICMFQSHRLLHPAPHGSTRRRGVDVRTYLVLCTKLNLLPFDFAFILKLRNDRCQ